MGIGISIAEFVMNSVVVGPAYYRTLKRPSVTKKDIVTKLCSLPVALQFETTPGEVLEEALLCMTDVPTTGELLRLCQKFALGATGELDVTTLRTT